MHINIIDPTINTIDAVIANDHVIYDVFECVIGITIATHEYIDRHVVMFWPGVDGDVRLCECNYPGYTLSLIKFMKIAMKDLGSRVFCTLLHNFL